MKFHGFPIGRFVVSRLLWLSGLSRLVVFRTPHYRLRFFPSSVSAAMFCDRSFFARDEAVLRSVLRPGDTFIDVGANIGTLTLFGAGIVGPAGRVLAIEAHPKIGNYLAENVRLNGCRNIQVVAGRAMGSTLATTHISSKRSDDQNVVMEGDLEIEMSTLDSVAPPGSVRLLKIDVEGFEFAVLQGARKTLTRTACVYFESWEPLSQRYGYSTRDVFSLLHDCGFELPVPVNHVSSSCENFLAKRSTGASTEH